VLADPVIAKLVGYSSALFRTVLVRDCLVGLWALSRRLSGSQLLDGAFFDGCQLANEADRRAFLDRPAWLRRRCGPQPSNAWGTSLLVDVEQGARSWRSLPAIPGPDKKDITRL
jgi:hypothetical protein